MNPFILEGEYSIADLQKIANLIKDLPAKIKIDYSHAKLDEATKIILDDYNINLSKINPAKGYSEDKEDYALQGKADADKELNLFLLKKRNKKIQANANFLVYILSVCINILVYSKELFAFTARIVGKKTQHPFQRQIMFQDTLNSLYTMGIQAIPIVIFLSFSYGIIIALQSVVQLKTFGGELYAIDVVILSFFKGISLFIAIIILAARSGSSIISKIGIMKISDEWDALKILKIDPEIFLLQPKILAFTVLMPFLAYIGAFFGMIGGYVALQGMLHLNFNVFFGVLQNVDFSTFTSILWKGPICGLIIGLICTFETTKIALTSESVINGITRGVVYSIFASILIDTILNIVVTYF